MNARIKIVKRSSNAEGETELQMNGVVTSTNVQPAEIKRRDIVNTVKSWIAEFEDRKRFEAHSLRVVRCSYD